MVSDFVCVKSFGRETKQSVKQVSGKKCVATPKGDPKFNMFVVCGGQQVYGVLGKGSLKEDEKIQATRKVTHIPIGTYVGVWCGLKVMAAEMGSVCVW